MLKVRNISNVMQKRLIRPLYAQTQATPYAAVLDASLRNTDGSFRAPIIGDAINGQTARVASVGNAFLLQGGLVPGTVMIKSKFGEAMMVASGNVNEQPFGLLANFVGGTLDDLQDNNEIGVWRGPDAVFELLKPAWNDTGLANAYTNAIAGGPVTLYADPSGLLAQATALVGGVVTNKVPVARLIERSNSAKIVIELVI
jgi:hypothetical protein